VRLAVFRVMEAPPTGSSRSAIGLRILAAALVVLASLGVKQLVLDDEEQAVETRGARIVDYRVDSELIGEELPVTVVIPRGARDGRRSLLVFLHGRGADEKSYLYPEMFAALARQGGRAPVVAFPRGGPDSYWHDREGGRWGSYVLEELVPSLVQRFEIEPERVAIGGISMGGFGAFDLGRQRPGELCAIGGHSPAVWLEADQAAPGAFDDAGDFERNDVIELVGPPASPLAGKRVWVDVGEDDPFAEAARELAESLEAGGARVTLRTGPGGHESHYWRDHWGSYMRFYARALKECQRPRDADG
jgi:S-formylglutathione hydrolase FrmB